MRRHQISNGTVPAPQILWQGCDSMLVVDEKRRVLAMNPAIERLVGRRSLKTIGTGCGTVLSCRNFQGCPLAQSTSECPGMCALNQHKPIQNTEYMIKTASGKDLPVSASYTPVRSRPGGPLWLLIVLRDNSKQRFRETQLAQQAMTDPLTQTANRTAFLQACRMELSRAARYRRPLAIAMVDMDNLKSHNDTYGHLAGDQLLKGLANLLKANHRFGEIVARYGGDEFAMLLPETSPRSAIILAERLRQSVQEFPFAPSEAARHNPIHITISVGVASYAWDGGTMEELLMCADRRLYEAKRGGRNRVVGPVQDRRQQHRVSCRVPIIIRSLSEASDWNLHEGLMENLSGAGLYLHVSPWKALEVGESLMVSLVIPPTREAPLGFRRLTCQATIVRVDDPVSPDREGVVRQGVAVAFNETPDRDSEKASMEAEEMLGAA